MIIPFPRRRKSGFDEGKAVIQTSRAYLSTEEVADLFGFSVRTISAWAVEWRDSGGQQGIPAFKMGRSWRFDRKEIQAYIDRKKLPPQKIERTAASA
jgi:excisionase family DNA binding protein